MAIGTPVNMGAAHSSGGTSATHVLTVTAGASVGDVVVAGVGSSTTSRVLSSVTDSVGNTYTIHAGATATGEADRNTWIATTTVTNTIVASSTIITATWESSIFSRRQVTAFKVTGVDATPDQTANYQFTGPPWDTGALPPGSSANAIVLGFATRNVNTSSTAATDYTNIHSTAGNTMTTTAVYRIVTSSASYTPGGTWGSNGAWSSSAILLLESGEPPDTANFFSVF